MEHIDLHASGRASVDADWLERRVLNGIGGRASHNSLRKDGARSTTSEKPPFEQNNGRISSDMYALSNEWVSMAPQARAVGSFCRSLAAKFAKAIGILIR